MSSPDKSVARATLFVIISACSFGSLTTIVLLVTREGLPLVTAMFWRYLLGGLMLRALMAAGAFSLARRTQSVQATQTVQITKRQAIRLMLTGGLAQSVITYLSLIALDYMPVGPLAFLFYTYPAWLAIISAVRGHEPLTLPRTAALVVAMAGIALMVGTPSSDSMHPTGVALALGTAVLYALYLPAIASAQKGVPALTAAFYLVTGVTISFFIGGAVTGQLSLPGTPIIWGYLALLSVVCTVIAISSLLAGLRTLGPVRTGIVATIEPFFTTLLGVVFLRDQLKPEVLAGGAMIAAAVILLQWQGTRSAIAADL